jgi:acetate kinase
MAKLKEYILVINSGSATVKFKVFHQADFSVAVSGIVEKIGLPGSFIGIEENSSGRIIMKNFPQGLADHAQAMQVILLNLKHWQRKIKIIGHRVVHGGEKFTKPTLITEKVLVDLNGFCQLAPLHNPINISCIKSCINFFPSIKNIGVFDTAYYKTLPDYAYLYSIPYKYYTENSIRRYGFHGISHQYVAQKAAEKLKRPLAKLKLITCHLGSGCSVTATKFGKAIETSMGFTPLEGLTMGTRSGDIDPSIILFWIRNLGMSLEEIETILNKKSGMLGIFGYSNDVRDIMTASGYKVKGYAPPKIFSKKEKIMAKLALNIFVYDIVRYIGSYITIMGGADYIVFTGGIGERNQDVRKLVMKQIKKTFQKIKPLVIPTNEELMIAKQVRENM